MLKLCIHRYLLMCLQCGVASPVNCSAVVVCTTVICRHELLKAASAANPNVCPNIPMATKAASSDPAVPCRP